MKAFSQSLRAQTPDIIRIPPRSPSAVIIGGGFAGLTAALYLRLANIQVLLIAGKRDKERAASALSASSEVHNWPGQIGSGYEIVSSLQKQVLALGLKVINQDITESQFYKNNQGFQLRTYSGVKIVASGRVPVIIATGSEPKRLHVPGEDTYWGRGVHTCAVCDGALYKNRSVIVVGAGDSAIAAALFLAKLEVKVVLVIRNKRQFKPQFKSRDIDVDFQTIFARAQDKSSLEELISLLKTNQVSLILGRIEQIFGDEKNITSVKIMHSQGHPFVQPISAVFLEIGHLPNSSAFPQLLKNADGTIKVNSKQETNISGVYAAGEVADPIWRQAITSSAQGAIAAMDCIRKLSFQATNSLAYSPTYTPTPLRVNPRQGAADLDKIKSKEKKQELIELNGEQYKATKEPVLISASWCHFCKTVEEKLIEAKNPQNVTKIYVDKLSTKEFPELDTVVTLPTLKIENSMRPIFDLDQIKDLL